MSGRNFRGAQRGRGAFGAGESQRLPFRPNERGRGGASGSRGRGHPTFGGPGDLTVFSPGYPAVLNTAIKTSEDHLLSSLNQDGSPTLPKRPGYGTRGRPVLLWANYFQLKADGNSTLFRYSVGVEAGHGNRTPAGKLIKQILRLFIDEELRSAGHDVVTDFRATVISRSEINLPVDGFTIKYRSEEEDEPAPGAKTYVVRMQHNGTLSLSTLLDYTASASASSLFGNKQEVIQALNLIVGHHPKVQPNTFTVGRNRHAGNTVGATDRGSLGAGLEALRAFVFSVRAATERVLVNVQLKNLAFYSPGPLEQLARAFISQHGSNPLALLDFLKMLSVDVMHIRRNNKAGERIPRYKRIIGLATRVDGRGLPNPPLVPSYGAGPKDVQFFLQEDLPSMSSVGSSDSRSGRGKKKKKVEKTDTKGRYISVYDFFRERYDITIKDTSLPVINVRSVEDPSYLPMQVCEVRPGQAAKQKLSLTQTQQMIRFGVRKPVQNAQSIVTSGLGLLGLAGGNPYLDAFGISIDPHMITVPGRVMQPPAITYASAQPTRPAFGSWNLSGKRLLRCATLEKWTYLVISLEGRPMVWQSAQDFHDCLNRFSAKLKDVGIRIGPYMAGIRITIKLGDPELQIETALKKFAGHPERRPAMVLVVVPSSGTAAVYNRVKYTCDIEQGLINMCVVDEKFAKANDQYFANVGLKLNLKLGGCNHAVAPADFGIISTKETMFVGIDVTHPSPGSLSTAPSVAGIVSSVDEWLAQWPADLRIQQARKEMVDALEDLLQGCLRRWQKRNRSLPRNIVVYRDGVSESQYQTVIDAELPALRKATEAVFPATDTKNNIPRLAIVIVGKRHHTRFYATEKSDADRSGNPQSGTVVDRGVTEVANWDFFLQAHSALQGTARPAHYYVVHDEVFRREKLKPPLTNAEDALEQLSHSMCYLFGRATKAVSVCPPAFYADLVCERARCYLAHFYAPTPPVSSAVSVSSGGAAERRADEAMVRVHEQVRDTMFYI